MHSIDQKCKCNEEKENGTALIQLTYLLPNYHDFSVDDHDPVLFLALPVSLTVHRISATKQMQMNEVFRCLQHQQSHYQASYFYWTTEMETTG